MPPIKGRHPENSEQWTFKNRIETIPEYQRKIEEDCKDPLKTKDEILKYAIELGLNEDRLKKLTKGEICREVIQHLEIIGG